MLTNNEIEKRMIAYMETEDQRDIYTEIAAQGFCVFLDEVTPAMRLKAKEMYLIHQYQLKAAWINRTSDELKVEVMA